MGEPNYYDKICHDRFDRLEARHDMAVSKINDLTTKIDNGLTGRVKRIDKLIWLMGETTL